MCAHRTGSEEYRQQGSLKISLCAYPCEETHFKIVRSYDTLKKTNGEFIDILDKFYVSWENEQMYYKENENLTPRYYLSTLKNSCVLSQNKKVLLSAVIITDKNDCKEYKIKRALQYVYLVH